MFAHQPDSVTIAESLIKKITHQEENSDPRKFSKHWSGAYFSKEDAQLLSDVFYNITPKEIIQAFTICSTNSSFTISDIVNTVVHFLHKKYAIQLTENFEGTPEAGQVVLSDATKPINNKISRLIKKLAFKNLISPSTEKKYSYIINAGKEEEIKKIITKSVKSFSTARSSKKNQAAPKKEKLILSKSDIELNEKLQDLLNADNLVIDIIKNFISEGKEEFEFSTMLFTLINKALTALGKNPLQSKKEMPYAAATKRLRDRIDAILCNLVSYGCLNKPKAKKPSYIILKDFDKNLVNYSKSYSIHRSKAQSKKRKVILGNHLEQLASQSSATFIDDNTQAKYVKRDDTGGAIEKNLGSDENDHPEYDSGEENHNVGLNAPLFPEDDLPETIGGKFPDKAEAMEITPMETTADEKALDSDGTNIATDLDSESEVAFRIDAMHVETDQASEDDAQKNLPFGKEQTPSPFQMIVLEENTQYTYQQMPAEPVFYKISDKTAIEELVAIENKKRSTDNSLIYDASTDADYEAAKHLSITRIAVIGNQFGIVTHKKIKEDTFIGEYRGLQVYQIDKTSLYQFAVMGNNNIIKYYIDAKNKRNFVAYVNGSSTPNCEIRLMRENGKERLVLCALRDIHPNEQLIIDYGRDYVINPADFINLHYSHGPYSDLALYLEHQDQYQKNKYTFDALTRKDLGLTDAEYLLPKCVQYIVNNDIKKLKKQILATTDELLLYATQSNEFYSPREQQHVTLLMLACYLGNKEAVKLLLKNGSDVNRKTLITGDTPLILLLKGRASNEEVAEIIDLLIEYNCNFFLSNQHQLGALHFAIKRNMPELVSKIIIQAESWELEEIIREDDILSTMYYRKDNQHQHADFNFCLENGYFLVLKKLLQWALLPDNQDKFRGLIKNGQIFSGQFLQTVDKKYLRQLLDLFNDLGVNKRGLLRDVIVYISQQTANPTQSGIGIFGRQFTQQGNQSIRGNKLTNTLTIRTRNNG